MQGIAEFIQRQRLHMELDIGALAAGIRPREDAELRRRHGQRPAAAEGIIEPHQAAPEQRPVGLVEGADAFDLVDRALLQMVLQVATHALAVDDDIDAERRQPVGGADAGPVQDLRRSD